MLIEESVTNRETWTRRLLLLSVLATAINVEGNLVKPRLGDSVPVYSGQPHLDEFMRSFIHREDDAIRPWSGKRVNVFQNLSTTPRSPREKKASIFSNRNIEVKLCDDIYTLLKTYFHDFYIEGLHQPWRAIHEDWTPATIAKRFGIDPSYLTGHYSFVLLRVIRDRDTREIADSPGAVKVKNDVVDAVNHLIKGGKAGFNEILNVYGSHYITSYTTGNSVYQVIVYERSKYDFLETEFEARSLMQMSKVRLDLIFSPCLAVHQGKILTASGNRTVETWAAENLLATKTSSSNDTSIEDSTSKQLRQTNMPISRPSLMHLHKNKKLWKKLGNLLREETVIAMRLEILSSPIRDTKTRDSFRETLLFYMNKNGNLR